MRIMSFNIRRAFGEDGATSIRRIANVIEGQRPDLVGLNEVWHVPLLHNQPASLGRRLSMEPVFQNNVQYGGLQRYGNLILAAGDVVTLVDLKLPGGLQQRGAIFVETELDGRPVVFGSTHLGLSRATRRRQIAALVEGLPAGVPLVLAGDFNVTDDREFEPLLEVLHMAPSLPTYSSYRPSKALDRIFFSDDLVLDRHFSVASKASDHLPLVADFSWRERGSD